MAAAVLPLEKLPPSARQPRTCHCQCCGYDKDPANGRHEGLSFTCSSCLALVRKTQEKKEKEA